REQLGLVARDQLLALDSQRAFGVRRVGRAQRALGRDLALELDARGLGRRGAAGVGGGAVLELGGPRLERGAGLLELAQPVLGVGVVAVARAELVAGALHVAVLRGDLLAQVQELALAAG